MIYYFLFETIEDLGEGQKGQHEDSDVFCTHEGLSKATEAPVAMQRKVYSL